MPKKFYNIDTSGKFYKNFFSGICAAMSVLPEVLTQVMPLGT
jgi:hypothetical protein